MKKFEKLLQRFHLKKEKIFLIVITLIAGFLRIYNLNGTLQFLGDQGRDSLIVYDILIHKDPVFIGPVTSVGNMYLGPLYYYFMLPFYALTYPSPMGPVYAVALMGILTVPLLYILGKEMVGKWAAFFATVLYAFCWTFIELTRFSWNPNPAPLVSLLMIWSVYRAWTRDAKYWILTGILFSVLIQLHYLTLLAGVAAGVMWIITLIKPEIKNSYKKMFGATFAAGAIFLASLFPLVLFDMRHDGLNVRAFQQLIFGNDEHLRSARKLSDSIRETHGRSLQLFYEITIGNYRTLNTVLLIVLFALIVVALQQQAFAKYRKGIIVLCVWVAVGILGTAFYRSTIFDHYISFLFPVSTLLCGLGLAVISQYKVGKLISMISVILFIFVNMMQYQFRDLGWTINEIRDTSQIIEQKMKPGEKYNIVLLASHRDIEGMNYRYFLTASGKPPASKEDWGDIDTLVIINEEKKLIDFNRSDIYEIVVFPTKTASEVISIPDGPDISFLRRP